MARNLCYIQPLKTEEWNRYFPMLKLFPRGIVAKIIRFLPVIVLKKIIIELPLEKICLFVIGLPCKKTPDKVVKILRKFKAEFVFSNQAMPEIAKEAERTGLVVKVFPGTKVRSLLFFEAVKEYLDKYGGQIPPIIIWGADEELGASFVHLAGRKWNSITIAGEDSAKLRNLAHSIIFETGVSLRISSDLVQELNKDNLIVLAKPFAKNLKTRVDPSVKVTPSEKTPKVGLDIFINEDVDGFSIAGPPIIMTKTGRKTFSFQWTFPIIEAILFLLTSQGKMSFTDIGPEKDKYMGRHDDNTTTLLRETGFRILLNGQHGIISIYP